MKTFKYLIETNGYHVMISTDRGAERCFLGGQGTEKFL